MLTEIVMAPEVYKKIVGMQMLVEGLAMGAFANGYRYNRDPVARARRPSITFSGSSPNSR